MCFDSICKLIEEYTKPTSGFFLCIFCGYILVNISTIFQAEGNSHKSAPSKSSRSKGESGVSGKVDSAGNSHLSFPMSKSTYLLEFDSQFYGSNHVDSGSYNISMP